MMTSNTQRGKGRKSSSLLRNSKKRKEFLLTLNAVCKLNGLTLDWDHKILSPNSKMNVLNLKVAEVVE